MSSHAQYSIEQDTGQINFLILYQKDASISLDGSMGMSNCHGLRLRMHEICSLQPVIRTSVLI